MRNSLLSGLLFAAFLCISNSGEAAGSSAKGLTFQIYYGNPYKNAPDYYDYNSHRPFRYRYYKAPAAPYQFTYGW